MKRPFWKKPWEAPARYFDLRGERTEVSIDLHSKKNPRRKAIYEPLSADQIRQGIGDMSAREFAKLTGSDPRRVDRWKSGEETAPHWVALILTLFTIPGAVDLAYELFNELGEMPEPVDRTDDDGANKHEP